MGPLWVESRRFEALPSHAPIMLFAQKPASDEPMTMEQSTTDLAALESRRAVDSHVLECAKITVGCYSHFVSPGSPNHWATELELPSSSFVPSTLPCRLTVPRYLPIELSGQ